MDKAVCFVKYLLSDLLVDCLALGEVAQQDLDRFRQDIPDEYSIYDGTLREGRVQFETGVVFNRYRLRLLEHKEITDRHGTSSLRLANHLGFLPLDDPGLIHVFVSHWPSHLVPDSEPLRINLASRLRSVIESLLKACPDTRIIIMGDLNEEPFHLSLEGQLLATRDRGLAQKHPSYLYNPFWRHLGESQPYTCSQDQPSFAGTCRIATGRTTKWKTVDQIIVSSAFLGRSPWYLNEELTKILYMAPIGMPGDVRSGIFDHLPVLTTIERVQQTQGIET